MQLVETDSDLQHCDVSEIEIPKFQWMW